MIITYKDVAGIFIDSDEVLNFSKGSQLRRVATPMLRVLFPRAILIVLVDHRRATTNFTVI